MSRTELERLARIRMQVTGETLERAMAVLEGHATTPTPHSERATKPDAAGNSDLENGETEDGEAGETHTVGDTDESNADSEKASKSDARRTPQKRGHLRGL
ncbi:hypothetical protein SLV14_007547 [Streptomyces sp. Je 1-4]|uniref:hypothetical protein n=1 Tax=Streptomyces TaxID=1883 RepID=UPI0021D8042C|nr:MULTISPECIES: hypothetical protein [unclassified Streptomyces]UYB44456.1 hypothetical protein SLV14_007547 [Streptomyces sp. Je 1-4]UZQ40914.1 hypothetical protein SLV14N_007547 [Streptomyces sp. Je 1-4] [Streptomyces sp. Je 1-4 4N24]UZQ48331.1 hypothetical protein SLV14NA_007547 [Streptomyces sp. Je 1-4] [Streptomyces sp. Je 1-4 4N24_ara]